MVSEESAGPHREAVLPPEVPMFAIEASVSPGWRPFVGPGIALIGVDRFGASAPGKIVMREYGFSVEHVIQRALDPGNHLDVSCGSL
jgi:transketolase